MKANLTLFDRLMLAITFAEANEATPAMDGKTGNTNHPRKARFGKKNNDATLLHGGINTKAHA